MSGQFLIIGGGIGGLSTAIALQRQGLNVTVFEKAPKLKGLGAGLVIAANAMKAYRQIGISKSIQQIGNSIAGASIRSENGRFLTLANQDFFSNPYGLGNYAIHRAELHQSLISLLEPGTLIEGKACDTIEQNEEGVEVYFEDGTTASGDFLIGADGIHSSVRKTVLPDTQPRYSGYTCWRSVIEIDPADFPDLTFSETWGMNGRFGIVPLTRKRIYFFATKNAPRNDSRMANWTVADLLINYQGYHAPISNILKRTQDADLIWNDIIDIAPIKQFAFDRILLLGDAAHATTPNLGQGACMAIEDAATLMNCLKKEADPKQAFKRFEQLRLARTTRIVNNSWQFGKLSQTENRLIAALRNLAVRFTPNRLNERQFKWLYEVDLG